VKNVLAAALIAVSPLAMSQTPSSGVPKAPPAKAATESCAGCGVVRSVRRLESVTPATPEERKSPSGFVATVPLGGGKGSAGSITDVRRDEKPPLVRYEVVVQLDDGRFQVITQDEADRLRVGDKVRIERGKVTLR
jgi:hypothetical protein